MREVNLKREITDIAAPRLTKEPSMALYSRPTVRGMQNVFQTSSNTPTLLAAKTGQDKSLVMANLRRRLRFELLKTVLIAVRGHRGRYYQKAIPVDELDLNLVHTTNDEDNGDDVDNVDDDNDEDDEDEDVEDVEDVEDEDVEE